MTASGAPTVRPLRWLARQGGRIVRTLDPRRPAWERPLPQVGIELGRWAPAWVVVVVAGVVALGCVALVADSRPQWVLASVLVGLLLVRPSGGPPVLFALWLGLQVAGSENASYGLGAAVLILGLHLIAVLLTTASDLHPRTRIELRVLVAPLRRMMIIQAVVQPVAWATMTLSTGDVIVPWLRIAAAAGVALTTWVVVRRMVRTD